MCGITGFFNIKDAQIRVADALQTMRMRGKDGVGICSRSDADHKKDAKRLKIRPTEDALGHSLHSIVGFTQQPLIGKGRFAANCEIYNWKELNSKFKLEAKNDAQMLFRLVEKKGIKKIKEILKLLDGVYAFCYWIGDEIYIARDIVGVKPVWYAHSDSFCFASEMKALEKQGIINCAELNPRQILKYSIKKNKINFIPRNFFSTVLHKKTKKAMQKELAGYLINAIAKRIPDKKFGILFSGGIDSTIIALICKQLGVDFTCYTAALAEPGLKEAEDLVWAKRVAKRLGFKLKVKTLRLNEVPKHLKKLVPLIETTQVTKVGVGLTFHLACGLAKKDGIKVIFSGLGSEEIFAGYQRHEQSSDINKECVSGLLKMYERDTYRDDVITMANNLELRVPFLDKTLIEYALKIPAKFKMNSTHKKVILREVAEQLGMPKTFAWRKKRAAQYGSRFDSAIDKLKRKSKMKLKAEYLKQFYPSHNLHLGALFSSGKDSTYAAYVMMQQNYDISCLITVRSRNPDSYMFHTPNIDLTQMQAEALGIPIVIEETDGKKEYELQDLKRAIKRAKKEYKLDGIITGALYSTYQRERIEKMADELGLKVFSPLWHKDQEVEMREIVDAGFEFMLSSIACYGLDKSWLGKKITHKEIDKLVELNKKVGINVAGEGGEFESLVLNGPIFSKRIEIVDSEIVGDKEAAKLIVNKAVLKKK